MIARVWSLLGAAGLMLSVVLLGVGAARADAVTCASGWTSNVSDAPPGAYVWCTHTTTTPLSLDDAAAVAGKFAATTTVDDMTAYLLDHDGNRLGYVYGPYVGAGGPGSAQPLHWNTGTPADPSVCPCTFQIFDNGQDYADAALDLRPSLRDQAGYGTILGGGDPFTDAAPSGGGAGGGASGSADASMTLTAALGDLGSPAAWGFLLGYGLVVGAAVFALWRGWLFARRVIL